VKYHQIVKPVKVPAKKTAPVAQFTKTAMLLEDVQEPQSGSIV